MTPDRAGYEQFVGLWLNRNEVLAQAQWIVYVGTSYAGGTEDLPPGLFLAAYPDEASAFEAMVKTNNARSAARVRQQPRNVKTQSLF